MTRRRRDLKKEEFWRRMERRRARSGLSVRAWCLQHNLQPSAFYWWRRKLDRCGAICRETVRRDADRPAPAFVPVRLTEDSLARSHPAMEILLANGRRIRLWGSVERPMLAEVLAVLEGPAC
jgi:transposase-like protein